MVNTPQQNQAKPSSANQGNAGKIDLKKDKNATNTVKHNDKESAASGNKPAQGSLKS